MIIVTCISKDGKEYKYAIPVAAVGTANTNDEGSTFLNFFEKGYSTVKCIKESLEELQALVKEAQSRG